MTDNINIKKLIYLGIFLVSCIHEIAGHLSLRVHSYICKINKAESPTPLYPSSYAKKPKKESGEFIEEHLV